MSVLVKLLTCVLATHSEAASQSSCDSGGISETCAKVDGDCIENHVELFPPQQMGLDFHLLHILVGLALDLAADVETEDHLYDADDDGDDDDDVVEIKEEAEEPEVKKPFKDPLPLNSFGGAGIFSNDTAADKASTSTNTETIDGTSIIGDAPYLPKTTEIKPKLKLPETPNFSHIKNKTQKRELYAKFLKEKRKIEKARGEDRRKRRMNETQEERDKKKALFGKTTAQVDYSQKTIENQI